MGDLVNKKVRHFEYGVGVIKDANEERVVVEFDIGVRMFPLPDAIINNYLLFGDDIESETQNKNGKETKSLSLDNNHYRKLYREDFKKWIDNTYNKKADNPINDSDGYATDAFFIEKNCPQRDFLSWLESEETLEEAREALLNVPKIVNGKTKPSNRVSGYITIMRLFKEFLIDIGKL